MYADRRRVGCRAWRRRPPRPARRGRSRSSGSSRATCCSCSSWATWWARASTHWWERSAGAWAEPSGRRSCWPGARGVHGLRLRRAGHQVPQRRRRSAVHPQGLPALVLTFIVAFAVMLSGITSASTLARAFGGDHLGELFGCSTSASAAAGGRWTPGCCRPSSTRRTIEARRGLGGRFLATVAIGAVERLDLPVRQDQVDRLLV